MPTQVLNQDDGVIHEQDKEEGSDDEKGTKAKDTEEKKK